VKKFNQLTADQRAELNECRISEDREEVARQVKPGVRVSIASFHDYDAQS
jgi:hypothetical protein